MQKFDHDTNLDIKQVQNDQKPEFQSSNSNIQQTLIKYKQPEQIIKQKFKDIMTYYEDIQISRPIIRPEMYSFEFVPCDDNIKLRQQYEEEYEETSDSDDFQSLMTQSNIEQQEKDFNVDKQQILNYCISNKANDSSLTHLNIPMYFNNLIEMTIPYDFDYVINRSQDKVLLANKYVINTKQYSQDGMFSYVFSGEDILTHEKIVAKVNKSDEQIQQMINEVKILKYIEINQNNNSNFVHLKDYFFQNMRFFIIMEDCGKNTYQLFINRPEVRTILNLDNLQTIKNITQNILDATKFLKQIGINHFDIKPENICVKNNQAKLIDIGSCAFFNTLKNNFYLQSRFYRAPEAFLCLQLDNRADIYSLGSVLYEILASTPLFSSNVETQFYIQQLAGQLAIDDQATSDILQISNKNISPFGVRKFFDEDGRLFVKTSELEQFLDNRFIYQQYGQQIEMQQLQQHKYLMIQPNYMPILELLQLSIGNKKIDQKWFGLIKLCQKLLTFDVRYRPSSDQINFQEEIKMTQEEIEQYERRIEVVQQAVNKFNYLFGSTGKYYQYFSTKQLQHVINIVDIQFNQNSIICICDFDNDKIQIMLDQYQQLADGQYYIRKQLEKYFGFKCKQICQLAEYIWYQIDMQLQFYLNQNNHNLNQKQFNNFYQQEEEYEEEIPEYQ